MKVVSLDVDAHAEIIEAAQFYERRQDGLGERFLTDVFARLERLPTAGFRPIKGPEGRNFQCCDVGRPWPYRVIVDESETEIRVLAIAHDHRHPEYWHSRAQDD